MNRVVTIEVLKPERVKEVYANHGEQISLEEAAEIIKLLNILAYIAVDQILRNENRQSIRKS